MEIQPGGMIRLIIVIGKQNMDHSRKIVLITGTPGVGKSTISSLLARRLNAILLDINQLVDEKKFYTGIDEQRKFKIVDLNALCRELDRIVQNSSGYVIIEGHLSHYYKNADLVIVLRANPIVLRDRLKAKGFDELKIRENIEAEAIDLCSFEAFRIHGDRTNEIDTSDISPDKVVNLIVEVMNGDKKFPVGKVDFLDWVYP
jgi:adenylate kinase